MRTSATTFQCATNEEVWSAERTLLSEGYHKTSDCYWYKNFENEEGIEAYIERV